MTSIKKAKKAFKKNPYYKGRCIMIIWYYAITDFGKTKAKVRLRDKQLFSKFSRKPKVYCVTFHDMERLKKSQVL